MDSITPPGPREPTSTIRFTSGNGMTLYGELFVADGPAAALVVHGYAEHCGRYRELASVLTSLGLTTFTFDLRGHGRSEGQRGHVREFDDYLVDIEAALAELRRRAGAAADRVLLVSHSNGALASLRLLADPWRCPSAIRAAVISSPLLALKLKVPFVKRLAARSLGQLLPSLSMPLDLDIGLLTHDQGKLGDRRVDTLCNDVASARWFNGMLRTQEWVATFAHRIAVPTLWLIAAGDLLCDAAAASEVAGDVPAAEVHLLADMLHEVFNEIERGHAFALAAGFARRTVLG
jgi:lysophospholipase